MASPSASSRPWAKRQRLSNQRQAAIQNLLHEGSISNSGLLRVLKKITDADLSVDLSKEELSDAYRANFEKVRVTETFDTDSDEPFVLELAEPALLISELVSQSSALSEAYAAAVRKYGCRGHGALEPAIASRNAGSISCPPGPQGRGAPLRLHENTSLQGNLT